MYDWRSVLMENKQQRVNFEMGELVRVVEGTHQDGMPTNRIGVITDIHQDGSGTNTGVYTVLFASSAGTLEMHFWHKFLQRVIT
tara:strand:+ start:198 stop:449 length:252 start_codon:yes stop_codon:yes gene_type:complete